MESVPSKRPVYLHDDNAMSLLWSNFSLLHPPPPLLRCEGGMWFGMLNIRVCWIWVMLSCFSSSYSVTNFINGQLTLDTTHGTYADLMTDPGRPPPDDSLRRIQRDMENLVQKSIKFFFKSIFSSMKLKLIHKFFLFFEMSVNLLVQRLIVWLIDRSSTNVLLGELFRWLFDWVTQFALFVTFLWSNRRGGRNGRRRYCLLSNKLFSFVCRVFAAQRRPARTGRFRRGRHQYSYGVAATAVSKATMTTWFNRRGKTIERKRRLTPIAS